MAKPLCFVIMGFGKKTDYSPGQDPRTLDLDATYEAIIKPAVEACGVECIRADKVTHSGLIDGPMYDLLFRADLVVADISTANPNAIYELGVRHALKPFSTIVMKEADGKFMFDLNHLSMLQYKHLGDDIGTREGIAKRAELEKLITAVLAAQKGDSPVFQFLDITPAVLAGAQLVAAGNEVKQRSDTLGEAVEAGRKAKAASRPSEARYHFERAFQIQDAGPETADPFILQQLALATYKSKEPDPAAALDAAWKVIERLTPGASTDPETLGIAGAIRKNLWSERKQREDLEAAIEFYGRGFEVKRDYYNGENYALCLDWRAAEQADPDEAKYDRTTARKVRERIIGSLTAAFAEPTTRDRADYKWMLATMANTLYAIGRDGTPFEAQFRDASLVGWELATFEKGKTYALALAPKP